MDSIAVLRPGLPHGDGAGVRGVPGRRAFARGVRAVPHRPGRAVVRAVQAVGHAPGVRRDAATRTRGRSRRRCTTCARRARPASSATGPRSSTATRSSVIREYARRRDEHREHDDAAGARRRRQRQARHRDRHPLAHERRERRSSTSRPTTKRQVIPWVRITDRAGNVREYQAEGVTPDRSGQGRAPAHGLRGLPQPAEPPVRRRRPRRPSNRALADGRDPADAAVRQARGGGRAQGDVPDRRRRPWTRSPRGCASSTGRSYIGGLHGPAAGRRARRRRHAGSSYKRNVFPAMNVDVGHVPEQHRAHGLPRLLPLPRREPQDERRQDDRAGLRSLPRHPVGRPERLR